MANEIAGAGAIVEPKADCIVQACQLRKSYRTEHVETHVLRDVSLSIRRGEFVSVTGPSGSGKSSLLAVLGLMEPADGGTLLLDGVDAGRADARARAMLRSTRIGFVFQFFHLINDLTVAENIALPMRYARKDASTIPARVMELAAQLGIEHRLDHYPPQLSGGQQQRVAIARALANDPPLLLVDEPTGNLDSDNGKQVMDILLRSHAAGKAICLVTHDVAQAAIASRRYVMRDGHISEVA